ncbi:MAG TPA: hypothetical protein VHM70_04885 [Polyangiaceae bacterium]|jgi:hypothetical protein|nr:hypothetical protein [Polyangiaceae bacterium]
MDGQRDKLNGNRRRRRRQKSEPKAQSAPVLIAARRPDSPRLGKISRRNIAASARPKRSPVRPELSTPERELASGVNAAIPAEAEVGLGEERAALSADGNTPRLVEEKPRRVARIAAAAPTGLLADEPEQKRERLLDRLITCEGRGAISRVANELLDHGGVPDEQRYQIQLLEHVDERRAASALESLSRLLEKQAPIKRPILDQRLRRLEEEAEEALVRENARELRRKLRATP